MKIKLNKRVVSLLKVLLKISISVVALYFVFSKIEISEVLLIFKKANPLFLILALILFVLSKTIASFRLNGFFKSILIYLSQKQNIKLYLLGMYYNLFLPGGIGGDGYKIYILNKTFNQKAKKIFNAVLLDRVVGIIALTVLSVVLFYFINDFYTKLNAFVWMLVPLLIIGFYLVLRYFFSDFKSFFLKANLYSFAVQLSQLFCAFFILEAIKVNSIEFDYLFIFLISSIVAIIPITIGGAGSREITFLYGATFLGLDTNVSIALSLMFYIITVVTSFVGIYFSFKPLELKITK